MRLVFGRYFIRQIFTASAFSYILPGEVILGENVFYYTDSVRSPPYLIRVANDMAYSHSYSKHVDKAVLDVKTTSISLEDLTLENVTIVTHDGSLKIERGASGTFIATVVYSDEIPLL